MKVFEIVPKAFLFFLIVSNLVFLAYGSEISIESVEIDLGSISNVEVTLNYTDITSNKISYLVPYRVTDFSVRDSRGELVCDIRELPIGTEFLCFPREKQNYSVYINYKTDELIAIRENLRRFGYQHNIVDPIDAYGLKVLLPEGFGILQTNLSITPISPLTDRIGSTGRRISIEWIREDVKLGDTVTFSVYFEDLGLFVFPYEAIIPIVLLLAMVIFIILRFRKKKEIPNEALKALKKEERSVVEFIKQQGGSCKQRLIVKELNLSKAKASRLIRDLEERNLIEKEKRGRTNLIKLK